jgi:hypothetical protein
MGTRLCPFIYIQSMTFLEQLHDLQCLTYLGSGPLPKKKKKLPALTQRIHIRCFVWLSNQYVPGIIVIS